MLDIANNYTGNDKLSAAAKDFHCAVSRTDLDKALELPRMIAIEERFHTIDQELTNEETKEKRFVWEQTALELLRQAAVVYEVHTDEPDVREIAIYTMELVTEELRYCLKNVHPQFHIW